MSDPVTPSTSAADSSASGITPSTSTLTLEQSTWLKQYIRNIPDYPQPGILFRDITPLLQDPTALRFTIETMANRYRSQQIDQVVGIESRGFIFGTPLAYLLGTGFVPVRKKGKLPSQVISVEYELEYGSNVLEMHTDSIQPGQRILVVDDLLATGGTTAGTVKLVEQLGAQVVSLAFLIELAGLEGRSRLPGHDVFALLSY
jgi:adenine phosphoribosyltransferase